MAGGERITATSLGVARCNLLAALGVHAGESVPFCESGRSGQASRDAPDGRGALVLAPARETPLRHGESRSVRRVRRNDRGSSAGGVCLARARTLALAPRIASANEAGVASRSRCKSARERHRRRSASVPPWAPALTGSGTCCSTDVSGGVRVNPLLTGLASAAVDEAELEGQEYPYDEDLDVLSSAPGRVASIVAAAEGAELSTSRSSS